MKGKIVILVLVILLLSCVMSFRVNAQGMMRNDAFNQTAAGVVSQNTLPDDSETDKEKLDELEKRLNELIEEDTGEDGQSVYFTEELADGLAAYINFSYKCEVVEISLLASILGAIIVCAVFDHFMR